MKVGGIILVLFGVLNSVVALAGIADYPDQAGPRLSIGIGMLVLGIYLLSRDQKKKEEEEDKKRWKNQDD